MTDLKDDLGDLLKRYKELDFIINNSPVIVFLWKNEENWPVEFVSENISQFGYTKDEFMSGKIRYSEIIYPEDLKRVAEEVGTYSKKNLTEFTQEYRILNKSKNILWIDDRTFVRRDLEGKITHFHSVILDVTEKKKIHEELESSKQKIIDSEIKYRTLFEQAEDAISLIDPESGEFLEFNRKAYEQLGYSQEEFKQLKIPDVEVIESATDFQEHAEKILKTGFDKFETKHRTKAGEIRDVYVSCKKMEIQRKTYILSVYRDITEQKFAVKKLKESEEKFRTISDQLLVGVGILQDNKVIYVNKKLCEVLGYSYNEFLNMTIGDFGQLIHPDSFKEEIKFMNQILNDPTKHEIQFQSKAIKKSGEVIWAENLLKKFVYNDRPALMGMFIDITERIKAENSLKFTQFTVDHSIEPAFWANDNAEIIYVNNAACRSLGYSRDELQKMRVFDFEPETTQEFWNTQFPQLKGKGYLILERYHRKKNGDFFFVDEWVNYVKFEGKEYCCAFARDISERKDSERKLKDSETRFREAFYRENFYKDLFMHDMRNILQSISASLEIYEYKLNTERDFVQNKILLENVHFQIDRGVHFINNIKKFSEIETFNQSLVKMNINEVIQMNISNMQKQFKNKKINFLLKNEKQKEYLIYGNELIHDLIDNILLNSIIHNDNEDVYISIDISKFLKEQKPYIKVQFSDNGRGIEDQRKNIIFNRAHNQNISTVGMGLGLSLVKIIIEKLDGYIWVEDRVSGNNKQGSKFIVLLPEMKS